MMNNKVYDWLKAIAQIWLPALATLYFTIAQIWGLPFGEQIVGTIAAIDTFLGAILQISSSKYQGKIIDKEKVMEDFLSEVDNDDVAD